MGVTAMIKGTVCAGCSSNGASYDNGMGPKPDKGQPFQDYRLQWGSRR